MMADNLPAIIEDINTDYYEGEIEEFKKTFNNLRSRYLDLQYSQRHKVFDTLDSIKTYLPHTISECPITDDDRRDYMKALDTAIRSQEYGGARYKKLISARAVLKKSWRIVEDS